jgi:hypothetical protein
MRHLIQSAICLAPLQTSCDVRDVAEICRKNDKDTQVWLSAMSSDDWFKDSQTGRKKKTNS